MCDKQREYFVLIVTCVDKTLRSAANIRVSDVILDTPAGSGSVSGRTLSIGATWRGIAREGKVAKEELLEERVGQQQCQERDGWHHHQA